MPPRRVIGVLLVPARESKSPFHGMDETRFDVVVGFATKGLSTKGIHFVSNPAIRERLAELKLKPGTRTGFLSYQKNHQFKFVAAPFFMPGGTNNRFRETGFGALVELVALKGFVKKNPAQGTYSFYGTNDDNGLRRAHYQKREIEFRNQPTVNETIRKTQLYVKQGYRKWKARRGNR